jgi:hypothetical protein
MKPTIATVDPEFVIKALLLSNNHRFPLSPALAGAAINGGTK